MRFRALTSTVLIPAIFSASLAGCANQAPSRLVEADLRTAIDEYAADRGESLRSAETNSRRSRSPSQEDDLPNRIALASLAGEMTEAAHKRGGFEQPYLTLGSHPVAGQQQPATQPAGKAENKSKESLAQEDLQAPRSAPPGYWKDDVWKQMGSEGLRLVKRDLWRGFEKSFWKWENALVLAGTWGASIAIRETGVDETVRGRVRGNRQLGEFDETLQLLSHPGTHAAAAGALWLGTTLMKDVKNHEVSKTLIQALAVSDLTVGALKLACNTRGPNDLEYAWPSGHTSSTFTVAAVLNEYYGPWVGIPSLAFAGFIGYQRIDSKEHDLSDVVFGGMLGYIVGASIAKENKGEAAEIFGMQLIPFVNPESGATGLALYKSFK